MSTARVTKPAKIAVITTMTGAKSMAEAMAEIITEYGPVIDLRLHYVDEIDSRLIDGNALPPDIIDELRSTEIAWFDVRGDTPAISLMKEALLQTGNVVLGHSMATSLGSGMVWFDRDQPWLARKMAGWMSRRMTRQNASKMANQAPSFAKMRLMMKLLKVLGIFPMQSLRDMRARATTQEYWLCGGTENTKNLLLYLARVYGGQKVNPLPPQEFPEHGIYHPLSREFFTSLDDYLKAHPLIHKQTVGMLLLPGSNLHDSSMGAGEIMRRLDDQADFIAVYARDFRMWEAIQKFFFRDGKPIVDIVISFLLFRMNGGPMGGDSRPTIEALQKLDVPVLSAPPMSSREIRTWKESETGLSAVETITHVTLPELDGCIEPIVPCGYQARGFDQNINAQVRAMTPIPDRLDRIAARVEKWLNLRIKPNAEKRIAIILYNYPPDESGVGVAGYLNTMESVTGFLKRLKFEGYTVEDLPDGLGLEEMFTGQGIVNDSAWQPAGVTARNSASGKGEAYAEWFDTLSHETKDRVIGRWDDPPGTVLTQGKDFTIPGIRLGNVFIGLQPAHGGNESDVSESLQHYHDKTLPPHHQYLAFYRWLEAEFEADAVIHFGTHGTLEFTRGKEVGLSSECFPDILMGNLPNLYVYMVSNPSEATIAKRRSYATIINHLSPVFTDSGLYDELAELEDLIHEYNEAISLKQEQRANIVYDQIQVKAGEAHFEGKSVEEIHDELFTVRRSIIPRGLHVFGENYDEAASIDFITFVLRYDRGGIKSLHRLLAEAQGIDYDAMMNSPATVVDGKSYAQLAGEIEERAREAVTIALGHGAQTAVERLNVAQQDGLQTSLAFGLSVAQNLSRSDETGSLLRGLCGRYIYPNIGGDLLRSPDALPTGSNTYQFDPRLVPSDAAYQRGAAIAEATLEYHRKLHGTYPESVGIILWAFETMNTRGETIGQILRYIGVEPVRGNPWNVKLRTISPEELGRPRIDVVVNICGIFRDTFPNIVQRLDKAFKLVALLDESFEENQVRKHSEEMFDRISDNASDAKLARDLAGARIFGPPPSEYGTSLRDLIRSRLWRTEEELGQAYLSDMQYAYTADLHGYKSDDVFRNRLAQVDITSQIRNSHDNEITDLDHYFEFSGGLARAVEVSSGKKPAMLFTDTTKEVVKTEEIGEAIQRGVRTRMFNPKWIEGMLEEGYNGAQHMQERVDNILGLAATTGEVDNWVWEEIEDRYVLDKNIRSRLEESNPWALRNMIERLFEASQRGYWEASEERLESLRDIYLEMEGLLEDSVS
ncbi:MAG: magnesium chelatase subunit H [Chloroflexota bacterium]|nr:magnesium chelatase subunit H [Chloroflexota bacterium]